MNEATAIARQARRLGYRAVTLGNASEAHWDALRVLFGAEDVADLVLADAVDAMIRYEAGEER